ncbi:MAG: cytochrome c maturation protein CcmE [Bacteroidia bacterium]
MKKSNIAGLIVIGIAISILISTMGDASTFVTFSEASKYPEKDFHVIGELDSAGELYYNPVEDPNYFSFYLRDNNGEIRKVVYHDTKPQDFERSEKVVIVGNANGEEFHATKILMKCPSKYNADQSEWQEASVN